MKDLQTTKTRHTRNVPNVKRALALLYGLGDEDEEEIELRRTQVTYRQIAAQCRCSVNALSKWIPSKPGKDSYLARKKQIGILLFSLNTGRLHHF